HLAHPAPRLAHLGEQPAVRRVPDGVEGGLADHAVVDHVVVPAGERLAVVDRDHHVRAVAADRGRDVAAQRHPVLDQAVRVVEELHDVDADLGGRRALLGLPQRPAFGGRESVDARLPAGDEEVGDLAALRRPPGDGGRTAVLQVVGMGHDGEPPFELLGERLERTGHGEDPALPDAAPRGRRRFTKDEGGTTRARTRSLELMTATRPATDRPGETTLDHLLTVLAAPAELLSDPDGQVRPEGAQGFYVGDTRYCNRLEVGVEGVDLRFAPAGLDGAGRARFEGELRGVRLRRERRVAERTAFEEITLHNPGAGPVDLGLVVHARSDLSATPVVKSGVPLTDVPPTVQGGEVRWARREVSA